MYCPLLRKIERALYSKPKSRFGARWERSFTKLVAYWLIMAGSVF